MPFALIIEDYDNVTPLEIALATHFGWTTKIASSGKEALDVLAANAGQVSAVITDLNLASGDGYEIITDIRKKPEYNLVPIIVVTGDGGSDNRRRAISLGANAFFSKPYSPDSVCQSLKGLMHAP